MKKKEIFQKNQFKLFMSRKNPHSDLDPDPVGSALLNTDPYNVKVLDPDPCIEHTDPQRWFP